MKYKHKLIDYLKDPKKSNKDLLKKLAKWSEEFEVENEEYYSNLLTYNRAKQKYLLMRWEEDEKKIDTKKSKCAGSRNYENEENGIFY